MLYNWCSVLEMEIRTGALDDNISDMDPADNTHGDDGELENKDNLINDPDNASSHASDHHTAEIEAKNSTQQIPVESLTMLLMTFRVMLYEVWTDLIVLWRI